MKIYLSLCLSLGFCVLAATCARADDDDKPIKPGQDPDINSPTYDGSTFGAAQSANPTAAEIEATREAQEARENEATWLIRGYQEQVKMKSTATGQADDSIDLLDPYARVSSDKDLAKLAGLTPTASPNPTEITSLHAVTDSAQDGPTLRIDPAQASPQQKLPPMSGDGFKPLITPLSATEAAGLHNFYSTLPAATAPPALADPATPTDVPPATDTTPITEMPGLTAAQSQHITQGKMSYDLTFEPLPDDFHNQPAAVPEDKSDDNALPQAPSGDTAKQLHRAVLAITTGSPNAQPTPAKIVIPVDPDLISAKPLSAPIMMGGRPQIQDPYDLLR